MQSYIYAKFIKKLTSLIKLVSKCTRGINEQLLKTSGADVLSSRKELKKTLIRRRVRLEFPAINFSLRKQSSLLSVLVFKNISPGVSDRKWQNVNSGEEREKTAVLAS